VAGDASGLGMVSRASARTSERAVPETVSEVERTLPVEPGARIARVRICGGLVEQPPSLRGQLRIILGDNLV